MNLWKKLPASLMTGFLLSAGQAQADLQNDGTRATSPASVREFIVLFGPLSPEIASRLRPYLRPAEVSGITQTIEDLRVQKMALALIAKAIAYINREGSILDFKTATEHREG